MPLKTIRGPENAPLEPLKGKTIAVVGFGNQGQAHALNLRDSGLHVIVANRPGSPNGRLARQLGFDPLPIAEAVRQADLIVVALPDEVQPQVFGQSIQGHVKPGATFGILHGFNIRYGLIRPLRDTGVIMIAPKGPGQTLRERFVAGAGIPCLFALHQDSPARDAQSVALAWAHGIGCARAGILFTTFQQETDTDLFGEQAVLCGGMTHLVLAAFETLVRAGFPPELAYLECCHEVKQIADLVYERGLAGMMKAISNTAEFGAYEAGPRLIDDRVRTGMETILKQIVDGSFARRLRDDHEQGFTWFNKQREALVSHPIESAGAFIRSLTATTQARSEADRSGTPSVAP